MKTITKKRQTKNAVPEEQKDFEVIARGMVDMIMKDAFASGTGKWANFINRNNGNVKSPYSQCSTVYKSVKASCDAVCQAKTVFKNYNSEEKVTDKELLDLFENPNPLMTRETFFSAIEGFYKLRGKFLIVKTYLKGREGIGLPAELWPMDPNSFEPVYEKNDQGLSNPVPVGWRNKVSREIFSPAQIVYDRDFSPDSLIEPVAPLEVIKKEIDILWQTLIFNQAFFNNSATPSLALSTENPLSPEQKTQLKNWIDTEYKGASKAFKTILLEYGLKAQQLSHTHTDMEFIEQNKYYDGQVLGIWRTPKTLFSITDDLNYATASEQQRIFWEGSVIPDLRKIYSALNRGIVLPYNPQIYMDFDISNVPAFKEVWLKLIDTAIKCCRDLKRPFKDVNEMLGLGFKTYPHDDIAFASFSEVPIDQVLNPKEPEKLDYQDDDKDDSKKQFAQSQTIDLPLVKASLARDAFIRVHGNLEAPFVSKIKNFYYYQRARALESLKKTISTYQTKKFDVELDWKAEDEQLIRVIMPYIKGTVNAGVKYAEFFKLQARNIDSLNAKITSVVIKQAHKIKITNRTVKQQITDSIAEVIIEGEKNGWSVTQIQDAIMRSVQDVYNITANRALNIARTQVTGSLNGGSFAYYQEAGIMEKQWLHAGDSQVRESHRLNGANAIVSIDAKFKNGLMYPGDADAPLEEIMGCRCSVAPVIKKQ